MSRPAPMQIEVISDVICPWCFIGKRHLEGALAQLAGEGLVFTNAWRPYQLNPDMPSEGISREMYRTAKFGSLAHSRELDTHVAKAGQLVGLEFNFDRISRTPNTVEAHRAIRAAAAAGLQDAMVERLFVAYFKEGQDIGQPAVIAGLAGEIGLAARPGRVRALAQRPKYGAHPRTSRIEGQRLMQMNGKNAAVYLSKSCSNFGRTQFYYLTPTRPGPAQARSRAVA